MLILQLFELSAHGGVLSGGADGDGGGGDGDGGGGLGGGDGGGDGGSASHRSQVFLQSFFSLFE